MPAPAGYPRWASAPSDPGDIVEPASGILDDGFNPEEAPPAQTFNWFFNLVYLWIVWFNEELLESDSRTIRFSAFTGYGVNSTGASPAFKSQVQSSGATEGFYLVSSINFAQWILPLSDLLPDGSEVLTVTALVQPGAARTGAVGSGTEKMYLTETLHIVSFSGETSSFSTTNVDSTHANSDVSICKITHSLGITIDRQNSQLLMKLTCGFDSAANPDKILGWEVTYTGRKWR